MRLKLWLLLFSIQFFQSQIVSASSDVPQTLQPLISAAAAARSSTWTAPVPDAQRLGVLCEIYEQQLCAIHTKLFDDDYKSGWVAEFWDNYRKGSFEGKCSSSLLEQCQHNRAILYDFAGPEAFRQFEAGIPYSKPSRTKTVLPVKDWLLNFEQAAKSRRPEVWTTEIATEKSLLAHCQMYELDLSALAQKIQFRRSATKNWVSELLDATRDNPETSATRNNAVKQREILTRFAGEQVVSQYEQVLPPAF